MRETCDDETFNRICPCSVGKQKTRYFLTSLQLVGIKYSINKTVNDLRTKLSVKTFKTKRGAKLESLVNVSAAEVEISCSGGEKNLFSLI